MELPWRAPRPGSIRIFRVPVSTTTIIPARVAVVGNGSSFDAVLVVELIAAYRNVVRFNER